MLRFAAESGTREIVATPHVSPDFPNDSDSIHNAFSQLYRAADGIIGLHLGCDFHLTYDNLQQFIAQPDKYTINGLRYLMVELPEYVPFGPVTEALQRILDEGVIPVITHPERNPSLQQNSRELGAWIARGCLSQVTGQSYLGHFGSRAKAAAHRFLMNGMVHVVASDAHDLVHRPPSLKISYDYLSGKYGQDIADQLFRHNAAAIVRGEDVKPVSPPHSFWSRLRQRISF